MISDEYKFYQKSQRDDLTHAVGVNFIYQRTGRDEWKSKNSATFDNTTALWIETLNQRLQILMDLSTLSYI